jgi:hypothetical protein
MKSKKAIERVENPVMKGAEKGNFMIKKTHRVHKFGVSTVYGNYII